MMSLLKASIFLLTVSPLAQACSKLMDGKDKKENKKEIVELMRKLADMLEEQTPIDPADPNMEEPRDGSSPIIKDTFGYPSGNIPLEPWVRSGDIYPEPPPPKWAQSVGHPPAFGIDIVKDCALWDDGSCGAKAAEGDDNRSYNLYDQNFKIYLMFCNPNTNILINFEPWD